MPEGPGGHGGSAVDFSFDAPAGWLVCHLDGADPFAALPARAEELIARRPDLAMFRELFLEAAAEHGRRCRSRRSVAAAVRCGVGPDDGRIPRLAFAELEVIRLDGFGDGEARLGAIAAGAAVRHPADEVAPLVDRVRTAGGPAVRAEYVRVVGPGGAHRMGVEYWLPIAGCDRVAHLVFSHGNLAATAAFVADYAHIAGQLRVTLRP